MSASYRLKRANTTCCLLKMSLLSSIPSYCLLIQAPSSFSKPPEPHNGPPPGTVYFAPDTGSYREDPPCVHLPITSIQILIHPSGLTGPVPLGDAHLSPLMRAPLLRKREGVGGLGGIERGRRGSCGMRGPDSPFPVMDDGWEIKKARSRVISAGNSAPSGSCKDLAMHS